MLLLFIKISITYLCNKLPSKYQEPREGIRAAAGVKKEAQLKKNQL
jgi:hypothetical protein